MEELFENKKRIDMDSAWENENTYAYYDRSARAEMTIVRNLLNKWFTDYPDEEKKEMKARFKKTFAHVFYELFLFHLFKNQGFDVIVHPIVPGRTKRPDFLISKNDTEIYIEATVATKNSENPATNDKMVKTIYDTINKIVSHNFLLKIDELEIKTSAQPSLKKLIKKITHAVKTVDPDKMIADIALKGINHRYQINYEDEKINIIISLIPLESSKRDKNKDRPIGMYPIHTYWGNAEQLIKDAIIEKAMRYGKLDKPYIICVNAIGILGTGEFDIENALWGSQTVKISMDQNNPSEKWYRKPNGIFYGPDRPRKTNVSGVLITKVMECNLGVANHWLAKHPLSANELNFNIFDLSYQQVIHSEIKTTEKKSIPQLLGIDKGWLGDFYS